MKKIKNEEVLSIYKSMFEIRRFEETCHELYLNKRIPGMSPHLYIGEEAIAASVCHFLEKDDYIVSTHRGHGHCLAKGARMDKMFAEIMGKETGYCKGRGGSMHIADINTCNLGANGIVGAGLPIAVGAGFSINYRDTDQIAVCFFGDAASNQGTFHEAVNMAAAMNLPVLFICENNQYGLSTPITVTCPTCNISDKAHGYGIEHATIDGMDAELSFLAAKEAVEYVRRERKPYLIEFIAYRFLGHSASDNRSYRTREEEAEWMKKCPIKNFRSKLLTDYNIEAAQIEKTEQDIEAEVKTALKFAEESPYPKVEDVFQNIFTLSGGVL
ncbi:MAG: thiamine pyrophosphate-dependent dehydrogenase E1 component subunit alpha [Clostridiales bacterium]|nr:thiamine pyrophosphate-dependent dehydrogenase E1 component subunit alpha [Clostridiales bacterium]